MKDQEKEENVNPMYFGKLAAFFITLVIIMNVATEYIPKEKLPFGPVPAGWIVALEVGLSVYCFCRFLCCLTSAIIEAIERKK